MIKWCLQYNCYSWNPHNSSITITATLSLLFGSLRDPSSCQVSIWRVSPISEGFHFGECYLLVCNSQYDSVSYQHATCQWHTSKQPWAKFTSKDGCAWWGLSDFTEIYHTRDQGCFYLTKPVLPGFVQPDLNFPTEHTLSTGACSNVLLN